jgi:eukaryotic-like serine/threonine-protein kinase
MAQWDVPGYTGLKKLGSGGFGDVVLARHDASGTLVAIKYLRPSLLADAEFTRLFRTEAEVLATVDDPHVVRLYEYVESPSGAAIVMELIDGVSLREILSHQGATTAEAALVVLQGSLLGLAAAHQRGVVHRDYKPENVLVNGNGDSKLTDFGIAARAGDSPIPAGTMVYAPPEQFAGSPATPASDVYAATATFYESLVGRPPFTGDTAERLLYQHLSQPVPLDPVPEPLRPLVAAGMAKDPRDRPADGTTFVTALNAIAAGAYGQDWADRGRSHLGEAALLLAALWPSGAAPTVQSSAVQQVNLSQNPQPARNSGGGRHLSPEARHRWHLRHLWHLAHLRHLEHLEHLEQLEGGQDRDRRSRGDQDRRVSPVKAALAATAALALVGAGTALAVTASSSSTPAAATHSVKLQQVQLHPSLAGTASGTSPGSGPGSSSASPSSGSSPGLPRVSAKKHSSPHEGSSSPSGSSSAGSGSSPGSGSSSRSPSPGSGSSSRSPSPGSGSSSPSPSPGSGSSSPPPKPPQPEISGISPASGPAAGGTAVTMTGTGLGSATGVSFGGAGATITADSATQITVTSPAGSGTVDVTVTTPGGTAVGGQFTYEVPPPVIDVISPSSGPESGGTTVTISGSDLAGATGVSFGGVAAKITADSGTQITVISPAGSGTVDVTVTTPGGTSAITAADRFTYVAIIQ